MKDPYNQFYSFVLI